MKLRFKTLFILKSNDWKQASWTNTDALLALSIFAPSVLASFFNNGTALPIPSLSQLILSLPALSIIAVLILLHRHYESRTTFSSLLGITKDNFARHLVSGVILAFATMPILIALSMKTAELLHSFGIEQQEQNVIRWLSEGSLSSPEVWVLLGHAVVLAPISEEILWRRIILCRALSIMSPISALVAVSLGFAAIHTNIQLIPSLFLLGIGFSVSAIMSKSLVTSIAFHATFNTLNIILLIIAH